MAKPGGQGANSNRPGTARDKRAVRAASDSVDVGRLLPGEDAVNDLLLPGENPDAGYREDVELWIKVYSELLDFKRFMLDGATTRAGQMTTAAAKKEIETTDLRVARAEAERFMRRLAYWRGRQEALKETERTTSRRR